MALMLCKCGQLINLDDNPEAFYIYDKNDREIELENPMCNDCKDAL